MRKFRLRNGIVVIEAPGASVEIGEKTQSKFGYIDDYRVVSIPEGHELFEVGEWICLVLTPDGLSGGAFGTDYDAVGEIHD